MYLCQEISTKKFFLFNPTEKLDMDTTYDVGQGPFKVVQETIIQGQPLGVSGILPKEITKDCDTGAETVSFSYFEGVKYAKEAGLLQTDSFTDMRLKTHFLVCCGDVMISVEPADFPSISRRVF